MRATTTVAGLALACLLGACRSAPPPPAQGAVRPTVAGVAPATYASAEAARAAFTRWGGSLRAVLEDAAWLAFEGDAAVVEAAHRAYFEHGYTTFQVELRSDRFARPTEETFVLEDARGARLEGRPVSFVGSPVLVDDRWFSSFSLSFPHVLTRETGWLRLTRLADAATVEWRFEGP